jgi:hypothetical protein
MSNPQNRACVAEFRWNHPTLPDDGQETMEEWLGDLDSNQGCPGQSREFYR